MAAYHEALGLRLQQMELSADLSRRLQPAAQAPFEEDCLLVLAPAPRA